MTVSAEQILLFTVPVAGSLAVNTDFPVAELVAVTLATKSVGFSKWDHLSGNQTQRVAVVEVVTVQAPSLPFGMVEDDVVVHVDQFATLRVGLHLRMTVRAWENVFGKWWRRYGVGFPFICAALVFLHLFLNDQVASTVKKFLDLGSRDYSGAKCQRAYCEC